MITKKEMDKVIFDIGNFIHIRRKGFLNPRLLTAQEIIDSVEFKMEFEKPFPILSKFILDNFKEVQEKC